MGKIGIWNLNDDVERRAELLGIGVYKGGRDYQSFSNLDAETLQILMDENFANPNEKQNEAPTIGEFLEWMKANPSFKAIGYAIGEGREDYRVSIEGVESYNPDGDERQSFISMFRKADEFDASREYCRCWYD